MGRPKKVRPLEFKLPDVPPNALDVFGDLEPDERSLFITEVFQALVEMRISNDLKQLQNTIDQWYRTLITRRKEGNTTPNNVNYANKMASYATSVTTEEG